VDIRNQIARGLAFSVSAGRSPKLERQTSFKDEHIYDDISSSTISHNKLRGSAGWGFGLLPTGLVDGAEAVGNKFIGNDISRFTPSLADVIFFSHTRDNIFRGPSGIVIDFGTNNLFTD
jgi:hypothetical protein